MSFRRPDRGPPLQRRSKDYGKEDRHHRRVRPASARRLPPQGTRVQELPALRPPALHRRPRQQLHRFRRLHVGHRRARDVQPLQVLRQVLRRPDGRRLPAQQPRVLGPDVRHVGPLPVPEQHPLPPQGRDVRVPRRPRRGTDEARLQEDEELQGVHRRGLRRRHRQALHAPLQLQGLGAPGRADEQGVDRRARRGAGRQPRDQERRAWHRRLRLGPEQPVQVPAVRRHRRVLPPHGQVARRAREPQQDDRLHQHRQEGDPLQGRRDRQVRPAHRRDAARQAVQRRDQRRDAPRDQARRRGPEALRRVHGRHRHQAAVPEHQVVDVLPGGTARSTASRTSATTART